MWSAPMAVGWLSREHRGAPVVAVLGRPDDRSPGFPDIVVEHSLLDESDVHILLTKPLPST